MGFAGGFRRSELAALQVEDLEETPEGLVARLRCSNTDPEGQGRLVALPYGSDPLTCPVRAVRTWLERPGIHHGPLFRAVDQLGLVSDRALAPDSVAWIVKRATGRAGLEEMEYAGHSLRAGLATQAAMNGATELAIMKQPATAPLPLSGATSAMGPYSGIRRPPNSGCDGRACVRVAPQARQHRAGRSVR